jgi:hypothetical protein
MSLDEAACSASPTRMILPSDAQVIHTVFGVDGTLVEDQHADQLSAAMSHLELEVGVINSRPAKVKSEIHGRLHDAMTPVM